MLRLLIPPNYYFGGALIRFKSARVAPMNDASGTFFANIPLCSRKDLRNAVEAAAKVSPGWAARNAYNRRQILYRLAEMLEARASEMTDAISLSGTPKRRRARSPRQHRAHRPLCRMDG